MIKKISLIIFVSILLVAVTANAQVANAVKETKQTENFPLTYGLVIDNSGSYRLIFETVIKSANQIVEANNPEDEAFLVRFVDTNKISLVQDFTSSTDELRSAVEDMFIEGGQTAILDAVNFSAKHLAKKDASQSKARKVLILITDGEDRKSQAKIEDVIKLLKDEKIQVFTLGLSDGKVYKNFLEKLSKETGGRSFAVEKGSDIQTAIKQLTVAVRAQ